MLVPDDLLATRQKLFAELPANLTDDQRSFLASLVEGEPDWSMVAAVANHSSAKANALQSQDGW